MSNLISSALSLCPLDSQLILERIAAIAQRFRRNGAPSPLREQRPGQRVLTVVLALSGIRLPVSGS
ncbi:hypothetical protein [Paraburkholderia sp. RAU2J]|uniref:hypothetical protein n=1 Tax=Paraburkholderia sp. RAU2J TaxID=1938810 RepID=UPI0011C3453E|nr:hypothetical protein [Paraburkholderia sp. RAU2J]